MEPFLPVADHSDALSALAPLLRVRPELQSLCRFEGPWASPHGREGQGWAPFHMVTAGACILDVGGDLHPLVAGDVAILPHGDPHAVRAHRQAGRAAPPTIETTDAIAIKTNGPNPDVELICGRLAFEHPHDDFVRAALPKVIVIGTATGATPARVRLLLTAIRDELDAGEPGALSVSRDLARGLLVLVLRIHFQANSASNGHLRLLGDRHTARLLTALMADPARAWSLDMMAATAGLSRATLVREFRRLADATPFDVLSDIRLGLARQSLAIRDRSLAEIAFEAGYQSQGAFSRAFKRRFHQSPSDMRTRDAAAIATPPVGG